MSDEKQYQTPTFETSGHETKSPYNDLELQFMLTQPGWGREATDELFQSVQVALSSSTVDEKGNIIIDKKPLWGILSYYTRDLRLGNLSALNGEMEYCRFWLDFSGLCLRNDLIQSFLSSLTRVITVIELSQSKSGFLRRRQGTITQEKKETTTTVPASRNIMGGHKKQL